MSGFSKRGGKKGYQLLVSENHCILSHLKIRHSIHNRKFHQFTSTLVVIINSKLLANVAFFYSFENVIASSFLKVTFEAENIFKCDQY